MQGDSVVDGIRRIRHDYAKRFGFNLRAMAADLRRKEQEHPERRVSLTPKHVRRRKTAQGWRATGCAASGRVG